MPLPIEEIEALYERLSEFNTEPYAIAAWVLVEKIIEADMHLEVLYSPARQRYEARITTPDTVYFGRSKLDHSIALYLVACRYLKWVTSKDEYAFDNADWQSDLVRKNTELRESRKQPASESGDSPDPEPHDKEPE